MIALLPPLPVVGPLAVAALLLGLSKVLPRRVPDLLAIATALAAAACCAAMAGPAARAPIPYWFGGWHEAGGHEAGGQVIGISFLVDQASAILAALIALLFAATLVFAWGFFATVHAHFHVIMLAFMAGMIGFCLTHDLFNLFVWFELLSVAGFAATGYALRRSALAGALNFTVLNTVGSYVFLLGLGLIYARLGALDLGALGRGVAASPHDPVLTASFALLATGLLVKAAQVPFHFWLGDAHAVASSPVSVIFSGAMVSIGVFGVAKLLWLVFAAAPEVVRVARTLLLGMGLASAVLGGAMALSQRHIKRLLAFSTISHVGIMTAALALMDRDGTAGMLAYVAGHGMVKAGLFMVAGLIAAKCGGIDEIEQRGSGRPYWPVGVLMAWGGLLLAGLPVGSMAEGIDLLSASARRTGVGWAEIPILIGSALTGAAVLRVAGRVFAGWGDEPGAETRSPSEREQERGERPTSLLVAPMAVLLALGTLGWDGAGAIATHAASALIGQAPTPGPVLEPSVTAWLAVAAALLVSGYNLGRHRLPRPLTGLIDRASKAPVDALRAVHSGLVTDYLAWLAVGLALFAAAFALA